MRPAPFRPIPHLETRRFAPHAQPATWQPGDFLLVRGHSFYSRLIMFGERLRVHGGDRRFTWCSHAALVISPAGDMAEMLGRGAVRSSAAKYAADDYYLVRVDANPADIEHVLAFAGWVLAHRARYGWLDVVSIAITMLTGAKFAFFIDGEYICSGFVARAMERTGAIFSRDPVHITPADLAKYYDAPPPAG
jgi:hypothetical protein